MKKNLLLQGFKYMTSIPMNMYIDKLDDIVNMSKDTYHSLININLLMYNQEHILPRVEKLMRKILKLKTGNILRISKYKNTFGEEVSLKKLFFKTSSNIVPRIYAISNFK